MECFFVHVDFLPCTPKLETVSSESVTLHGHCGAVYNTQFSPDSSILLSASEDTSGKFKIRFAFNFYFPAISGDVAIFIRARIKALLLLSVDCLSPIFSVKNLYYV